MSVLMNVGPREMLGLINIGNGISHNFLSPKSSYTFVEHKEANPCLGDVKKNDLSGPKILYKVQLIIQSTFPGVCGEGFITVISILQVRKLRSRKENY